MRRRKWLIPLSVAAFLLTLTFVTVTAALAGYLPVESPFDAVGMQDGTHGADVER